MASICSFSQPSLVGDPVLISLSKFIRCGMSLQSSSLSSINDSSLSESIKSGVWSSGYRSSWFLRPCVTSSLPVTAQLLLFFLYNQFPGCHQHIVSMHTVSIFSVLTSKHESCTLPPFLPFFEVWVDACAACCLACWFSFWPWSSCSGKFGGTLDLPRPLSPQQWQPRLARRNMLDSIKRLLVLIRSRITKQSSKGANCC
jgi:hypothetical protein